MVRAGGFRGVLRSRVFFERARRPKAEVSNATPAELEHHGMSTATMDARNMVGQNIQTEFGQGQLTTKQRATASPERHSEFLAGERIRLPAARLRAAQVKQWKGVKRGTELHSVLAACMVRAPPDSR